MLTEKELIGAIQECESGNVSYGTCQKLATFYTIYDHLYGTPPETAYSTKNEIEAQGESDFMRAVSGKDYEKVMRVVDELMDALLVLNPRLYDGVMRRVAE